MVLITGCKRSRECRGDSGMSRGGFLPPSLRLRGLPSIRRRRAPACFVAALMVGASLLGGLVSSVLTPLDAAPRSAAQDKKIPTLEDAKVYREAMVWFKAGEAMIGTPQENSAEQAALFRKALTIKPDFVEAHYNLGLILANRKQLREAVDEFAAVLRIDPKYEDTNLLLASTYRQLGDIPGAIRALEEGLARKGANLRILKPLAYLQYHDGREAAAMETFLAILKLDPADGQVRIDLATLQQKHNRLEEAAENYRLALTTIPDSFESHYNLALIYIHQKNNSDAVRELQSAEKLSPGKPEVLERLGDVYELEAQHDKAVAAYQHALTSEPERSGIFAKLGFALASLNRVQEAIAALTDSVRLSPGNPEAFHLLGDLYSELHRYTEAIQAYQSGIQLNPKKVEMHYNLGTVYAELKQYQEALSELRAAVELDSGHAPAWTNLAIVCEHLDLAAEAIHAHEQVLVLGKGGAINHFHLGILYVKIEQPDRAIAAFGRAIGIEPEKYRQLLREELKKVHSVLDPIRYREAFTRLLTGAAPVASP
jgi:tetratricopeptide (TPR) repeat protein